MGKFFVLLLTLVGMLAVSAYSQDKNWQDIKSKDAALDTDGDTIPDWWEVKFGLDPENKFDGKMDLDGDQLNNIQEYTIDSDPKNANLDKASQVSKDWMKFYKITDINAQDGKKGITYKQDYEMNLIPNDPDSVPEVESAGPSQKHPEPSMAGVRENVDPSIPANHMIRPNVWKYNDPIGDDKGPGYYSYPTNPVYVPGGFDILSFEVDASSPDNIVFKITVNADLKQDWGMAADFDVQHFQIYVDTDREPASGESRSLPGLNVLFAPDYAWDRVVIITPQPTSRVQVELDVKGKMIPGLKDGIVQAVIPTKISGQGRTITAVVKKSEMGATKDTDIGKWAWQVVSQSNEGYPDPEDLITRNVNEYRGLHRIGGGSDYMGDPELMDILVWPARGTLQEAKDQFEILNVWESYPDPKMDKLAVVPLLINDQAEQWKPGNGYAAYAKQLADQFKPPAQKDKYVSDNFSMYFKLFTRYTWNLSPSRENFIKNSLEVGFEGKAFTELVGYYMRWEIAKWDLTVWTLWQNDTPAQQPIALQSARVMLVKPLPTVDNISIGNYELDYSPWVMGAAWYPDRDKYKGIFIDGTIPDLLNYSFTVHYPLNWIGIDWKHGNFTAQDFAYGLKVGSSVIPGLKLKGVGAFYSDWEVSPIISTNDDPSKYVLRGYNIGASLDAAYKILLGDMSVSLGGTFAYTAIGLGDDFVRLENTFEQDIDGNGSIGGFQQTGSGAGEINPKYNTNGIAATGTVKVDNILGMFSVIAQGFYIDYNYCAIGAARGDTAFGSVSGFGGSPTADVLEMNGQQSVHRAPQQADFISSIPISGLPSDFIFNDPVTSVKGIGWVNDTWEGIAASGWQGATAIIKFGFDAIRANLEGSLITFNNPLYVNQYEIRGMGSFEYAFLDWNGKAFLTAKYFQLFNSDKVTNGVGASQYAIDNRVSTVIAPTLGYAQQLSKLLSATLSYKTEFGFYDETDLIKTNSWQPTVNSKIFNRHRIALQMNYSLPIGVIKTAGEYWFENRDMTNATTTSYTGREKYGAYFVTEWEYAF